MTRHLAERPVIIADGHHRYETAVDYATRNPAAREKLMAFFPLEGPGLTILPNHRLVHDVPDFGLDRFLAGASAWFDVEPLAAPLAFRPENRRLAVVAGGHAVALRAARRTRSSGSRGRPARRRPGASSRCRSFTRGS